LTLDVSVTLGRPVLEQQLERSLNPGRRGRPGPTASADELLRRYVRNVPDPYDPILSQADSLLLTPSQLQQLRAAQRSYQTKRDANWRPLAEYLATLPEAYDVRDAFKRQEAATDAAWAIAWRDVHETLPVILSRVQLTLLPGIALTLWRAPEPPRMRLVISG
jgi:hypothetical protein